MLRGTTKHIIHENIKILMNRGHDEKSATEKAHAHARQHAIDGALTAAQRDALPDDAFALPGRRYPIHNANHARNALARVAQHGTPEEKSAVRAAVHARYPEIK